MLSIQDLLHRIRWDPSWRGGRFRLGYLDRLADRVVPVDFDDILFPPGERFSFQVEAEDGTILNIPYHRVREVWRDGECIWRRADVDNCTQFSQKKGLRDVS